MDRLRVFLRRVELRLRRAEHVLRRFELGLQLLELRQARDVAVCYAVLELLRSGRAIRINNQSLWKRFKL